MIDDHVGQIVDGDRDVDEALVGETPQNDLKQWDAADRQHGLGNILGQWVQALASAAGHENDWSGGMGAMPQVLGREDIDETTVGIHNRHVPDRVLRHVLKNRRLAGSRRDESGTGVHDVGDGRIEVDSGENPATDVPVGDEPEEESALADN